MSQENLEIIRQEYAAYASRDWEAFAHLAHPEIQLETLDAGTFRGLDEVLGLFEGWRAPFAEFRVEAAEVVDLGDRVAVVERYGGRGMQGSDAETWLEQSYARLISRDRRSGARCLHKIGGVPEPKRVPAGETATLHRCHHCGKRSKWRRNVDERSVEVQVGRVVTSEHAPDDLDPPLLAPEYRCPHCGHAHHSVSND